LLHRAGSKGAREYRVAETKDGGFKTYWLIRQAFAPTDSFIHSTRQWFTASGTATPTPAKSYQAIEGVREGQQTSESTINVGAFRCTHLVVTHALHLYPASVQYQSKFRVESCFSNAEGGVDAIRYGDVRAVRSRIHEQHLGDERVEGRCIDIPQRQLGQPVALLDHRNRSSQAANRLVVAGARPQL
jgi:hypothetical protein